MPVQYSLDYSASYISRLLLNTLSCNSWVTVADITKSAGTEVSQLLLRD